MYSGNIFPSDPDLRAVPMHFRSFGELSNLIGGNGKQSRWTAIGPICAYFYTKASQDTRTKAQ